MVQKITEPNYYELLVNYVKYLTFRRLFFFQWFYVHTS